MAEDSNKPRGLGGEGGDPTKENSTNVNAVKSSKTVLESNYVPNELVEIFEEFKRFLKQQKLIKEENAEQRFNVEPIIAIDDQIKHDINNLEVNLQNKAKEIATLKAETSDLVNFGEIAYRSIKSEVSSSNVYINKYLQMKLINFEQQMNVYSKQIKILENHLKNLNKFAISSDELIEIIKKQHDTLIALAENVYLIHEKVNYLKLKGDSAIANRLDQSRPFDSSTNTVNKSLVGPNPFSRNLFIDTSFQSSQDQQQQQQPPSQQFQQQQLLQQQPYAGQTNQVNLFTGDQSSNQLFSFNQQSSKMKRWV